MVQKPKEMKKNIKRKLQTKRRKQTKKSPMKTQEKRKTKTNQMWLPVHAERPSQRIVR
jgi:hypothetical protein